MSDAVGNYDPAPGPALMADPRPNADLFVRRSSGLVREIGVKETFGIGAGILVLTGVFVGFTVFLQLFPGTDFYVPTLIGAVLSLMLGLVYSQLVGTFPRSGGEYVYASRIFSPLVGAMVGGAVLVAVTLNCANTVVQLGQIYIPFGLQAIGDALGWSGLVDFATTTLPKHVPSFVAGLLICSAFATISLRPVHVATRTVFWLFVLGSVGFLLIIGFVGLTSHAGFVDAVNKTSDQPNAYDAIVSSAAKAGTAPGLNWSAVWLSVPFGALIFAGFSFANYAGGEIKRPSRTYKLATLAAVVFATIGALLAWGALRHTAGLHFMQASATLNAADPEAYSKLTSLTPFQGGLAYALMLSDDPFTKILLGIGVIAAFLANGLGYFVLISRVVFALSFDRLLPSKMADVSKRSASPIWAVALGFAATLILTGLGDFTSFLTLFRNLILIVFTIFVIGCLAAASLPYRRRELYEASPKAIGDRWLGAPAVTVLGSLTALAFAVLVYFLAAKPAYSGGYHWDSILVLTLTATIGLVMYGVSRVSLRRRGIDLDLAMRELPPE
jgi:basic amino acid/polyamine antiporter, APA family